MHDGLDIECRRSHRSRVTQSGSLGLVTGVYNAAQAIFLRFKTQPGEVPLHLSFWRREGRGPGSDAQGWAPLLAAECKIEADPACGALASSDGNTAVPRYLPGVG
jgi:hypothetical protein